MNTTIHQDTDHAAGQAQLNDLRTALTNARAEEATLSGQLGAAEPATSALDRAKAMLTGKAPAARQDRDGLALRLVDCRGRVALLELAIREQAEVLDALVNEQSVAVNTAARPAHVKAVQAIQAALSTLRAAVEGEQAIRAGISERGYRCTLAAITHPDLTFADSQSLVSRFAKDVHTYLHTNELIESKSVNVRVLVATADHHPGDVVPLSGIEAAALVSIGHAEQTTSKPVRVPRQRETVEAVFS